MILPARTGYRARQRLGFLIGLDAQRALQRVFATLILTQRLTPTAARNHRGRQWRSRSRSWRSRLPNLMLLAARAPCATPTGNCVSCGGLAPIPDTAIASQPIVRG